MVSRNSKVHNFTSSVFFFFFVDYDKVWLSDWVIIIIIINTRVSSLIRFDSNIYMFVYIRMCVCVCEQANEHIGEKPTVIKLCWLVDKAILTSISSVTNTDHSLFKMYQTMYIHKK